MLLISFYQDCRKLYLGVQSSQPDIIAVSLTPSAVSILTVSTVQPVPWTVVVLTDSILSTVTFHFSCIDPTNMTSVARVWPLVIDTFYEHVQIKIPSEDFWGTI